MNKAPPPVFLILDVSYLMHRAFYAMGSLTFDGTATGALYGFFRDVVDLQDLLMVTGDHVGFACDYGYAYRSEVYPEYKQKRQPQTEEEQAQKRDLHQQIGALRDKWLPMLGYRNVFKQQGVEADDMIAVAVAAKPTCSEAIIVSADNDLWQLVRDDVWCYNPMSRKATTAVSFQREWGIAPSLWPHVKALAGDKDEIVGIEGIGPKSAAAYYAGKLKVCDGAPRRKFSKGVLVSETPCPCKYCKIVNNLDVHNTNIKLARIPCPGVEPVTWREDETSDDKWNEVVDKLGFKSLRK